jgi:cold shock CspA family protein
MDSSSVAVVRMCLCITRIRGEGHRSLAEGQQVEFSVTQGQKGLQAEDVAGL